MKNTNVLLIDDHELIRSGLTTIINSDDSDIKVINDCSNGEEAIEYLKKKAKRIDVILMDISMPKMNGVKTTENILALYPDKKIIALTMHSEEAYIMKMIEAGASGYLLKDSSPEVLIEAIKTVCQDKKYYSNDVSDKLVSLLLNDDKKDETELTSRELQILDLISKGYKNKEMGIELGISNRTIESHRSNIISKLGVKNTAELISYAHSNDLI